jgi:type II secretory pathway pseudopilin PulG
MLQSLCRFAILLLKLLVAIVIVGIMATLWLPRAQGGDFTRRD